ncbi:UPF0149 family protein [Rhodoferax sp. GW822-FHT02A01]|uniref:UPF0149 family protein n=1 Tax=Rhodoferax sp. GW822-FHT02A01 TaxID=3141537 RepID=UPI00315DF54A
MLTADEFNELERILDALRLRLKVTPHWEFCEGFLAALVCCRRPMQPDEYLPVLLTTDGARLPLETVFADAALQQRFLELWMRRWNAVALALDTPVTTLEDPRAYQPEVTDARAAYAALPSAERTPANWAQLASFGQLWAVGFLAAVNAWPEEWAGPRNKAAQHWRATTLNLLEQLTLDDTDEPTLSAFVDNQLAALPTVSDQRMKAFADSIWAVYNMRETWRTLGPRVETVHAQATPRRNDPCSCGSGRKFKKCCGGG